MLGEEVVAALRLADHQAFGLSRPRQQVRLVAANGRWVGQRANPNSMRHRPMVARDDLDQARDGQTVCRVIGHPPRIAGRPCPPRTGMNGPARSPRRSTPTRLEAPTVPRRCHTRETCESAIQRAIRERRPTAMTPAATDLVDPCQATTNTSLTRSSTTGGCSRSLRGCCMRPVIAWRRLGRGPGRCVDHAVIHTLDRSPRTFLCVQRVLTASSLVTRLRWQRRGACGESKTRSALRICTGRGAGQLTLTGGDPTSNGAVEGREISCVGAYSTHAGSPDGSAGIPPRPAL
jgi:hypothetical protein